MRVSGIILFLFTTVGATAQLSHKGALHQLDSLLANRNAILQTKFERLNSLKRSLPGQNPVEEYETTLAIYNEYKSFIYDSAFRYARSLQNIAARTGDPALILESKINLAFVLVSAGLFHEALDTLQAIHASKLPEHRRSSYYFLCGRTCYDVAEFAGDDFFGSSYHARGNQYIDSALHTLRSDEPQYLLARGLLDLHTADMISAIKNYEKLLSEYPLTDPEKAVVASTLSFLYLNSGEREHSKAMLIQAAVADLRSSTRETVALMNLAKMLYEDGEIEKAYVYIRAAMDDANFYGANHRKIQVASVFPLIEGKQLAMVEARKNMLLVYATGITLFALLLIGFGVIIFVQFRKLQHAKQIISESNERLVETNQHLVDANKIKEEYITYYFNTTADYISRLENLKKSMEMKLMTKKLDDLRFIADGINIRREREELYHNFDKVFLKLFPDFVNVFQSLFREEDRIQLKEGQLLNTELRIFALIRMGITDNEKISRILDYSVTTIYTYKTRIRNKSIVPNEEFDRRIMGIRTF